MPFGRGSVSPVSRGGLAASSSRTRKNAPRAETRLRQDPTICSTGCKRAAKQNAGGKHRADRRQPLDHQIGAKAEDQRLHRQPQEADDALHGGGAVARSDLALEHAVAVAAPAPAAGPSVMPMARTTSVLRRLISVKL